ncbi:hypothetical protein M758_UG343400 [Ceratodon purpureus]|nr:hypothetical protein M758_UG343400 [Ceratodon purpureus]
MMGLYVDDNQMDLVNLFPAFIDCSKPDYYIVLMVIFDENDLLSQIPWEIISVLCDAIAKEHVALPPTHTKTPCSNVFFELPQRSIRLLHFNNKRFIGIGFNKWL